MACSAQLAWPPRAAIATLLAAATLTGAQFAPKAGQWGKTDPLDLRVMTFNIRDGICSSNNKVEAQNDWCALARIVASFKPDILVMQECGDNSGNGTGGGLDSVANLATTFELFIHGGADPFKGGSVTAFVQKYAPAYDLPYIFVSASNDGFNRNVLLSRYPFADLNGDAKSQYSDFPLIAANLYAPGGTGGIRGIQIAEIDLPAPYAGDLVMLNAHLRSGSTSGDKAERLNAAKNTAYLVDHLLNGAGTGVPDPFEKIKDSPQVQAILPPLTPVVMGGDLNEDEQTNGVKGPAEWMVQAELAPGVDGTDRDRGDSTFDDAREPFFNGRATLGSSKLDYVWWQDSIASVRHQIVFDSGKVVPNTWLPPECVGFTGGANLVSTYAADHRPVIVDLILPLSSAAPEPFDIVAPADGSANIPVFPAPMLSWQAAAGADTYDLILADDPALTSILHSETGLAATSLTIPPGIIDPCGTYYWGVTAVNAGGSTPATTHPASFSTVAKADMEQDGDLDVFDFLEFQNLYGLQDPRADFEGDGDWDVFDFLAFQNTFALGGC